MKDTLRKIRDDLNTLSKMNSVEKGIYTKQVPTSIELMEGVSIPSLGFGTFQIKESSECEKSVYNAIEVGYRLIDTASAYENEEFVGNGIRNAIKDGVIKRDDIFLSTKIWVQDFGDNKTLEAVKRALSRLKTDYLDLCLLHYPFGDTYGAWRDLEKAHKLGLIKSIGVSNYTEDLLMDLITHCEIKPVINQVETNPFIQQIRLQSFLNENNIVHEAWSPFATGKKDIWENKKLNKIAKKYGVSVSQVIVRWLLQRGMVVVSKSRGIEHMKQNINVFGFSLDRNDIREIASINDECSVYFGKEGIRNPNVVKTTGGLKFNT